MPHFGLAKMRPSGWDGLASSTSNWPMFPNLKSLAAEVKREGFTDILLMGMGGSSLCPEVLALTYPQAAGFPRLHILDSVDPAQIRSVKKRSTSQKHFSLSPASLAARLSQIFISSIFSSLFKKPLAAEKAGSHFIAITDPGSKMQQVAERDKFRHIFYGLPSIGGRYSALSNFGMVPAAAMGLDLDQFLNKTKEMVAACKPAIALEQNPGVLLGLILGTAAKSGRDKITLITSPGIADLGAWLEQLIAESTENSAKALFPSIARNWARLKFTEATASSLTCSCKARQAPRRTEQQS